MQRQDEDDETSWSRTRSWSLCAGSSACSCPEGAEWPQQHHYHLPPPLSPHYDAAILDVGQPSPAPLYSLSVPLPPAAAMAMGKVDGVVIYGGGLQGEV